MNADFYLELLNKWCPPTSMIPGHACAFQKVRDIPYGSTGDRDPAIIVQNNLGSCSGKHILLHKLFKRLGLESKIITCLHHFDRAMPPDNDYPDELMDIIKNYRVLDFHHFIKLKIDRDWLDVDATWDRPLMKYGFPVNLDWQGREHTVIAVHPIRFYAETEDIIDLKMKLINELSPEERAVRSKFLELLTQWLHEIRVS